MKSLPFRRWKAGNGGLEWAGAAGQSRRLGDLDILGEPRIAILPRAYRMWQNRAA